MRIQKFLAQHDLSFELSPSKSFGWAACIKDSGGNTASIRQADMPRNTFMNGHGYGKTPVLALKDFSKYLSGKVLVLNAGFHNAQEIEVPKKLIVT